MATAMATSGTATVTLQGDRQMLITRDFNAPRHLVYRAITEPELVKRCGTRSVARSPWPRSTCASAEPGAP